MSKAIPDKDFDCVQFMREARDRITAQTADMTVEERVRWFNTRQHADPTLAKLAERARAELETSSKGNSGDE